MERVKIKMHTIEVCKEVYNHVTGEWSMYEKPWSLTVPAHEEDDFLIEEVNTELYQVSFTLLSEGVLYLTIDEKERMKLISFWRNMLDFEEFKAEAEEWIEYYEGIKIGCDIATIS